MYAAQDEASAAAALEGLQPMRQFGYHLPDGLITGGVSLSPGSGQALANLILTGKADDMLSPFSPARFRGGILGRRPV
jgi:hypothetical protein